MMAAKHVTDIPTGSPQELLFEGEPAYQINITSSDFLIFRSVHMHQPLDEAGQLNWRQVSRVQIVTIHK